MLRAEGAIVGRIRVAAHMRKIGIEALYRRANTNWRHSAHRIYPYLTQDLAIEQPYQISAMDTTYIPMERGFVYLTAVFD